jgi:hypothetical protein
MGMAMKRQACEEEEDRTVHAIPDI